MIIIHSYLRGLNKAVCPNQRGRRCRKLRRLSLAHRAEPHPILLQIQQMRNDCQVSSSLIAKNTYLIAQSLRKEEKKENVSEQLAPYLSRLILGKLLQFRNVLMAFHRPFNK